MTKGRVYTLPLYRWEGTLLLVAGVCAGLSLGFLLGVYIAVRSGPPW
jgi:hypothetical protein